MPSKSHYSNEKNTDYPPLEVESSDDISSDMTPNQIKIKRDLDSFLAPLIFDDLGDLEKFITDFNCFELDMREHYISGSSEYLWIHPTNEPESKFLRTNIFVTHHFRYNVHRYHCHNYFQICCCLNGSCSIALDGGDLPLNAGDLLILSPGTHHCLKVFCDDCNVLKLYIRKSTFDKTFFSILEGIIFSLIFQKLSVRRLSRKLYSVPHSKRQ